MIVYRKLEGEVLGLIPSSTDSVLEQVNFSLCIELVNTQEALASPQQKSCCQTVIMSLNQIKPNQPVGNSIITSSLIFLQYAAIITD